MFSKKKPLQNIFKKSMTYDNEIKMGKPEKLTKSTGMKIYFAHLYYSWERG
jgi:IS30 family transposase